MKLKRYNEYGQLEYMSRFQTRWQLEQWQQCWGVCAESEQYADQYEYQHWFSRRQELRLCQTQVVWLQKWLLITILARVHKEDLPFGLSVLTQRLFGALAKYDSLGWIPVIAGFHLRHR